MNKSLIAVASVLMFLASGSTAFAYHLPGPVSVASTTPISAGQGEVDFSKASQLTTTLSVDNITDETAYATAGNVMGNEAGYGAMIHENILYGISYDGGFGNGVRLMPLGFVQPNVPVKVTATLFPNHRLCFNVSSTDGSWNEFGLGVISANNLPSNWVNRLSAFNVSDTAVYNPVTAAVGSWDYIEIPNQDIDTCSYSMR